MNDTHPTIAIAELLRILIDEEEVSFDDAWKITTKVFAYTNHTVLPEALEKWEISLFEEMLPRHLQLIYRINYDFLQAVAKRWPNDMDRLQRMSIIQEGTPKYVRMAHLAIVGSMKACRQLEPADHRSTELPNFTASFCSRPSSETLSSSRVATSSAM